MVEASIVNQDLLGWKQPKPLIGLTRSKPKVTLEELHKDPLLQNQALAGEVHLPSSKPEDSALAAELGCKSEDQSGAKPEVRRMHFVVLLIYC